MSFDGFGRIWDTDLSPDQFRARAGAMETPPTQLTDDDGVGAHANATAPDGQLRSSLCGTGAKLEGYSSGQWYPVTALGPPNSEGACRVSFDGYGRVWDTELSSDQFRAREVAMETPPPQPVDDGGVRADANATAPDGHYRCHKISSGQLRDMGEMEVSGGRATLRGLPDGFAIRALSVRGTNDRGQLVLALDYRTASGSSERLDCLPR